MNYQVQAHVLCLLVDWHKRNLCEAVGLHAFDSLMCGVLESNCLETHSLLFVKKKKGVRDSVFYVKMLSGPVGWFSVTND